MSTRNACKTHVRCDRNGITMVECAIALPVMFVLLFAMLDLGIAAARFNVLAEAARRIARDASIHGSSSPDASAKYGPAAYSGTAADSSPIVQSAANLLPTMPKPRVNIRVTWLDGDNSPHDRVEVEVAFRHEPLIPALFMWGPIDLRSVSTMRIVN
jgi:Flp pilus assembly protein TadG